MFQEFEGGEEASLASFFRHLSVGGVARPVDTLLMAGLILYGSRPFEKAVQSKTKQLAYVFQVHLLGNSQQPCQNPRRLFLWHSATRRNQSPAAFLALCYQKSALPRCHGMFYKSVVAVCDKLKKASTCPAHLTVASWRLVRQYMLWPHAQDSPSGACLGC